MTFVCFWFRFPERRCRSWRRLLDSGRLWSTKCPFHRRPRSEARQQSSKKKKTLIQASFSRKPSLRWWSPWWLTCRSTSSLSASRQPPAQSTWRTRICFSSTSHRPSGSGCSRKHARCPRTVAGTHRSRCPWQRKWSRLTRIWKWPTLCRLSCCERLHKPLGWVPYPSTLP